MEPVMEQMTDRLARTAATAAAMGQLLIPHCEAKQRCCRLRNVDLAPAALAALTASTYIDWSWRPDPRWGAAVGAQLPAADDCRCGFVHVRKTTLALLLAAASGDPSAEQLHQAAEDGLRLSLGPDRLGAIHVVGPMRPHWLQRKQPPWQRAAGVSAHG